MTKFAFTIICSQVLDLHKSIPGKNPWKTSFCATNTFEMPCACDSSATTWKWTRPMDMITQSNQPCGIFCPSLLQTLVYTRGTWVIPQLELHCWELLNTPKSLHFKKTTRSWRMKGGGPRCLNVCELCRGWWENQPTNSSIVRLFSFSTINIAFEQTTKLL